MPDVPALAGYPGMPIDDSPANKKVAKDYFNNAIRPRRVFEQDQGDSGAWRKVEFGQDAPGSELYNVLTATPWDLKEFGLGVAMYFQTLQLLCGTFFLCALFQTQAVRFYSSEQYSGAQDEDAMGEPVPGLLKGSAVCTLQETVCLDPLCEETGTRNLCMMKAGQAYADLSMTVALFILFAFVSQAQNRISAALDESIQTAQDYSVIVDDPGPGDGDPDEWRKFFGQFGHTSFITIAKDNGPLLRALSKRRLIMREIIMLIGNGEPSLEEDDDGVLDTTWDGKSFNEKITELSDNPPKPTNKNEKIRGLITKTGAFGLKSMKKWKAALEKVNADLQTALAAAESQPYVPSKIFVTFETETGQRNCLRALSVGTLTAAFDWGADKIPDNLKFKGNVLGVQEAPEPNEVFWEDVDLDFTTRIKQQTKTWTMTCLLVVGSVIVCKQIQVGSGPGIAALWITITNIMVPMVLRKLCFEVEDHVSLNSQQTSLFLKLTFFRWMNTAVVIYMITDFTEFLTVKSLKQVQAVIMADAITSPIIRTLNIATTINHLIVSKYAPTQEKMNSYFLGDPWYPAERYADMTKTLFLALFYSVLFPIGLFLTCFGYMFIYTVDKYSLLRTWRTPAEMDDDVTKIARGHMFFGVYCHAVMAMVFFSEFPFDNICPHREHRVGVLQKVVNTTLVEKGITNTNVFESCSQAASSHIYDMIFGAAEGGDPPPALANDSMAGGQQKVVKMYSLLVFVLSVLLFIMFFGKGLMMSIWHLTHGSFDEDTTANPDHFTKCDIQAFIPIYRQNGLAYPIIAADVTSFETKYLPFEMPKEEDYLVQSMFNRAELPGLSDAELTKLFSEVHYFPPPAGLDETSTAEGKKKRKWGFGKKKEYEEVEGDDPDV